ncbi:MAG: hypothetical protein FWE07_05685 [Turicibacter sp.]|nr:hypothetical protein [Turicibacter sp.]
MKESSPIVKILCLLLLGFVPLTLLGFALEHWVTASPDVLPPFFLISVAVFVLWMVFGYLARLLLSKSDVLLYLNLPAVIVLFLILAQELSGGFWAGIGTWTQLFYLPLIRLASQILVFVPITTINFFIIALIAFGLLLLASFLGTSIREKHEEAS